MAPTDTARNLDRLEADLKRLETEYNMFFSGRLSRPPWETRKRVQTLVRQCDRVQMQNYADRFRFTTLQSRFSTLSDLWDRGLRAREEGRPGPFAHVNPTGSSAAAREDRVVYVAAFQDPVKEIEKLEDLYHAVADARRDIGDPPVPFHRFADLVRAQVTKMQSAGNKEVAFRVAVKDGKVNFTARALRAPVKADDGDE